MKLTDEERLAECLNCMNLAGCNLEDEECEDEIGHCKCYQGYIGGDNDSGLRGKN